MSRYITSTIVAILIIITSVNAGKLHGSIHTRLMPMPDKHIQEESLSSDFLNDKNHVDMEWAKYYNGPGDSTDIIYSSVLDALGNIYVFGISWGGTSKMDLATIKYNSDGDTLWLRRYNGTANDNDGSDLASIWTNVMEIDGSGNIYVAGISYSPTSDSDFVLIKYYPNGDTAWVRKYNGTGNGSDKVLGITVDQNDNVYVVGNSFGGSSNTDFATIKYDADGNEKWIKRYNGPGNLWDDPFNVRVDNSGNVYITGAGIGSGTYYDYQTIKYDSAGTQKWVQRYNGPGNDDDGCWGGMEIDASGNIYITGKSMGSGSDYDFCTIKYLPNGDTAWVRRYNGTGNAEDKAYAMEIDGDGNIYVAGDSRGLGTQLDYMLIKYNPDGDTLWTKRYNGTGNWYDYVNDMNLDSEGYIYITGTSYTSTYDITTIKYDTNGNLIWAKSFNAFNGTDQGNSVIQDNQGNIYVSGQVESIGDFDDFVLIKYVPTANVTSSDDSGIGSLRWAITQANNNPGADTITFTFSDTIHLDSELPTMYDNEIYIMGSNSPGGKHSVVLDGSNLSSGNGIAINSSDNLIEGLVITNFPENGVCVMGGASNNNTLSENLIFNNDLLAVDLNDDGPSLNDADDLDTGPNDLLNYPEIDSVIMNPDSTFNIYGTAADSAIIEIFMAHPAKDTTQPADISGHGEAYSYIGSDTADENGEFAYALGVYMPFYSLLTCTATDTLGNTSEFGENLMLAPAPLIIEAFSPVNLWVTDPEGYYIGRNAAGDLSQTIFPATYDDIDHDSINIATPIPGDYLIEIIGEEGAPPDGVYSIGITIDGSLMCIPVYQADAPMSGAIDTLYQGIEEWGVYVNGDPSGNETINILDITFLINYLYKDGPTPVPEAAGDADCNSAINILDVTYLINYLYKDGNLPCYIE